MDLVTALTAFPTVIFSTLMVTVLGYWLLVIVGAAGLDLLDGAGGHVSGGIDSVAGGVKAAGAAVDSVAGGIKAAGAAADAVASGVKATGAAVDGAIDSAVGGLKSAGESLEGVNAVKAVHGAKGGLFANLGFGKVPVTISASLIVLYGLVGSLFGSMRLAPISPLPPGLTKTIVFFSALLLATVLASISVRPLRRVFETRDAVGKNSFLGRLAHVTSLAVDAKNGTVEFNDGGAGLILHAVCEKKNELKKGDPVVLISYDPVKDVYEVEPADWLMAPRGQEKIVEISPDEVERITKEKDRA